MTQPVAPFPFGLPIEVERGTRDPVHQDVTYTLAGTIEGCAWEFVDVEENNDNRVTVIVDLRLYAPHGADIQFDDRVVLPDIPARGLTRKQRTYKVVGEVADWRNPFTGWTPGTVANLQKVR